MEFDNSAPPGVMDALMKFRDAWPVGRDVLISLLVNTNDDHDLRDRCLRALRHRLPFDEWPEFLQNIVQEKVGEENHARDVVESRRAALLTIGVSGFGFEFSHGLTRSIACVTAMWHASQGLCSTLDDMNRLLDTLPENPAKPAIREAMREIRNQHWLSGSAAAALLLPVGALADASGFTVQALAGRGIISGFQKLHKPKSPTVYSEEQVPHDLDEMLEYAEHCANAVRILNQAGVPANDAASQELEAHLCSIATHWKGAAVVLKLLHQQVPADKIPAMLDELRASKSLDQLSPPLQDIIEQASELLLNEQSRHVHPLRTHVKKAHDRLASSVRMKVPAVIAANDLVQLPFAVEAYQHGALQELAWLFRRISALRIADNKPDKAFWEPIEEAIVKEMAARQDTMKAAHSWNDQINPFGATSLAVSGIAGLMGYRHFEKVGNPLKPIKVHQNTTDMLNILERHVHTVMGKLSLQPLGRSSAENRPMGR